MSNRKYSLNGAWKRSTSETGMYRKFKSAVAASNDHDSSPRVNSPQQKEIKVADEKETIKCCWDTIDRQCSEYKQLVRENPDTGLGWKTVRLFVSSTFTDFFNEREILVKKVFPELREWCEERKISLIECDLRWGVPKDSTSKDTILTCLEEIDRCQEENGEPFFLNLLSERYGWIPTENDVTDEIRERYNWVSNTSITFMEILCGAYRMKNPNAAFFLRSPEFVKDIQEKQRRRFIDDEPLKKQHLQELKERIRGRFPQQTFDYACQVDKNDNTESTTNTQVVLTCLDDFAMQVLNFFKQAIEKKYQDQQNVKTLDEWEQERQLQYIFVKQKADATIGREGEVASLVAFARGNAPNFMELTAGETEDKDKDDKIWEESLELHPNVAVISPPGFGKTSLMASVTMEAIKNGLDVFYHFVGSTSASFTSENLIARLNRHVMNKGESGGHSNIQDDDSSVDKLKKILPTLSKREQPLLIVLDGVNQLLHRDTSSHLAWLPPGFPGNTRCIVSSATEHPRSVERLLKFPAYKLHLGEVSPDTRREIITASLGRFNKRLDSEQLDLLLSHPCAHQPLWLVIVCEELRVFGNFAALTRKISGLPETLDGLLEEIIGRLIEEDNTECMKKSLCLIGSALRGLPVMDMLNLLGDIANKQAVPLVYWAQVRRCLKPFIRTVTTGSLEKVFFFHQAMEIAVRNKLIPDVNEKKKWTTHIADYMEYWCERSETRRDELPDYLREAMLKPRLAKFLRESPDATGIGDFMRSSYLYHCRCRNMASPEMSMNTPVMLCMFCGMKSKEITATQVGRNSESCIICGMWLPRKFNSKPAFICSFHSNTLSMSSFMPKCFLCKKITKHDKNASQAILCHMCRSGMGGRLCAMIES